MNIQLKRFLIPALTFAYVHAAFGDMEGDTLKAACSSSDEVKLLICRTYLDAVIETHTLTAAAFKGFFESSGYKKPVPILWCPPLPRKHKDISFYDAHIDFDQARPVVLNYLDKHPDVMHVTAAELVMEAFSAAFPHSGPDGSCPKPR
ncbi:MAG: hypothetical protein HYX63_12820 [Gammaproteobacteria bacterium]|nr:hypothetical protein [Gammaproteobacteria bacterium]